MQRDSDIPGTLPCHSLALQSSTNYLTSGPQFVNCKIRVIICGCKSSKLVSSWHTED